MSGATVATGRMAPAPRRRHRIGMPVVPSWPRWHGLRGRATLAFAALALVLSLAMATGVWTAVSQYLLVQRERSTLTQALANADQLQRGLPTPGMSAPQVLSQLPREIGSTSLLVDRGAWFTTSLRVGRDSLPADLREAVMAGQASRQRIAIGDSTMLAVGIPLPGVNRAYFEVFSLDELDRTYRTLSNVLVAAAVAVPLASLVLGWWVTRPALRPLNSLAMAARAIAAGDLQTRIDPQGDPELAPLASSINSTVAALENRVRADARFAADVAHELRSPLTTVLSAVALLDAHRHHLPADGQEGLDLLRVEVDRFHRLVQDLLEISRTEAGSADLDMDDLCLADLVRWSLPERLRSRLEVDPAAARVSVRADKRRLERVVANLVENAETHGRGLSKVTVASTPESAQVVVDDAGPGVAPAERERVFERFARGRYSARTSSEGVGLGLSLVTRHVQLMGGSVSVDDSPDGGARFVVTLPVQERPCRG